MKKNRKTVEVIAYGEEPIYDPEKEYSMSELITGLNYYNYNSSHDNLKNYTLEYVAVNREDVDYDILFDLNKTAFKGTTGSMARMATRGFPFTEKHIIQIDDQINQLIELANIKRSTTVSAEKLVPKKPVIAVDFVGEAISIIDAHIDYCTNKKKFTKFKAEEYIISNKLSTPITGQIGEYYENILDNIGDKEGYTGKLFEQYTEFLENIIHVFYTIEYKIVRKPKEKKEIDPVKLVSKMNYMASFGEINSISPIEILGVHHVLLYNTKYNTVQLIIAMPDTVLTIRGSTIYNVDKERSIQKIVRKPESFLRDCMSGNGNIANIVMLLNNLHTKRTVPTGAMNVHTLILRIL